MSTSYFDMLDAVKNYYGSGSDQWLAIAKYGIAADNAESILSQVPGVQLIKNSDGSLRSYIYNDFSSIKSGSSIAEELNSNLQSGTASIVNNTKIKIPSDMGVNETGKLTLKSGMKTAGNFVLGEVVPAIAAAGVGISLGKTIDKVLYDTNPDFWDSNGMSSLNPDTWNSITSDDDSLGSSLFNVVFGIDANDTQAYIDENAYAYLTLWLKEQGVFGDGSITIDSADIPSDAPFKDYFLTKLPFYETFPGVSISNEVYTYSDNISKVIMLAVKSSTANKEQSICYYSENPFKTVVNSTKRDAKAVTLNNKTYYVAERGKWGDWQTPFTVDHWNLIDSGVRESWTIPYILFNGTSSAGVDGINNQENANLPDLSNIDNVNDALNYLKTKYPELWEKSVEQDVIQPDGTIKSYRYIPFPMPDVTSSTDTKPTTGNASQSDTFVDPNASTQTLIDAITSIITTPPTNTDIPDTGSGDTPPTIIPVGSASALYSIYNPSQNELNDFGSWLWSSNFVDQLLKLFNDPMQAIIGLHKVFAAPGISGESTIKVGYLDSGVHSNVVGSQYTTIDCGEISISEYFGNVFDYDPFTCVHIYLPFIGIEKLDTGDVMRGRLRVVYHVDVLTGACLAEIRVTRDGAGGTLYTYTGNCAVQYPISSGSYMGIIASMASVAGGVVGTIASGGALAPVAMGAVSGVLNAHTHVQHSGGFSGNAGAMGIKTPYVIITRPQTCLADNFPDLDGYPANKSTTLSSCSGFVKVKSCHVSGIPATDEELSEIEMLLKNGIII